MSSKYGVKFSVELDLRLYLKLAFLAVFSPFCESYDALSEAEVKSIDETIHSYETSSQKTVQRALCPAPTPSDGLGNFCLRSLILWDPLRQFSCGEQRIVCPLCQSKLRPWRWKNGHRRRDWPRNLYCIQNEVLLVSCIYLGEGSHHEVIAHDPSIYLKLKKIGIKLPFGLFYKSGVTDNLYEYVSISMQSGIGISDIERLLINLHNANHLLLCFNFIWNKTVFIRWTEGQSL